MTQEQTIKEDRIMGAGQDSLGGMFYRGVPVPENIRRAVGTGFQDDPYVAGWKDGADAVLSRPGQDMTETDMETASGDTAVLSPADEVNAFALVTEDRTAEARDIVSRMSGRDRAVLSFWLTELSDIVSDLEGTRRMSR